MLFQVEILIEPYPEDELSSEVLAKIANYGMKIVHSTKMSVNKGLYKNKNLKALKVEGKWKLERLSQIFLKHWALEKCFKDHKVISKWKTKAIYVENNPDISIVYN